jgi:hypothetical protein
MKTPRIDSRLRVPDAIRDAVYEAGAVVRLGYPAWLRALVHENVEAITLGRRVYLSPRLLEEGEQRFLETLRHELVHVEQVRKLGVMRFALRYVAEYVRNRRRGLRHEAAYFEISFEREARLAEGNAAGDA